MRLVRQCGKGQADAAPPTGGPALVRRPVATVWRQRRWRCPNVSCVAGSWTQVDELVGPARFNVNTLLSSPDPTTQEIVPDKAQRRQPTTNAEHPRLRRPTPPRDCQSTQNTQPLPPRLRRSLTVPGTGSHAQATVVYPSATANASSRTSNARVASSSVITHGGTTWMRLKLAKGRMPPALQAARVSSIAGLEPP